VATKTSHSCAIADAFGRGRPAFIPYLMAGDPDADTTLAMMLALRDAGADLIELGIPYGDPLADGPAIAAAGQRALARGTGTNDVFDLTKRARSAGAPPIVLFTYFNPVLQYGIERFAAAAQEAGAGGVIVPDVALEETGELRAVLMKHNLDMPLLVAPSTPPERAARIARESTGFVYVVSRLGVTGAGDAIDTSTVERQVAMLRGQTDKPLAVGFGISRAEHVKRVATLVDGIIVGSALIAQYAEVPRAEAASRVGAFAKELIAAI
jgi:tryptophan synthase alpha chain